MKKVGIISLGCAKNRVDSENILGLLQKDEYQLVSSVKDSDLVIINTCGFIDSAKKESIETIINTTLQNKDVVVCGCLVERYLDELKTAIPEVKAWIPIRDYPRFNEILKSYDTNLKNDGGVDDKYRVLSTGPFFAYLKIGEGCSNNCTYCTIPLIRGKYRSRDFDAIIDEAKHLTDIGIKEIVILEQDTTKYGIDFVDKDITIVTLLKELLKNQKLESIRLLYLYPDEISDELIDLISKEDRIASYFDIPIQHSESHLLKDMNRRGDKEFLINLFSKIKAKIPNAILRTTIMVGFPGETVKDINNLIRFINEIQFDHLGCFTYSKEDETISAHYPNQVTERTKKNRLDKVMKAQQSISYKKNKEHVGEIMEGFVIGKEKHYFLFRSYWNAPDDVDGKIYFESNDTFVYGQKVKIKIKEAFVYDLFGEIYEK